ncbi:putative bifunctional diguanylate cyclase/phosphodiesterase [Engelhardtia mirabilis]|uniref:Phytochrome-like protein cph2 n=1 Tax=Engelhardtia mirabilis TaxID=2528011 RepID=A0A518BQ97_9BACT|nr:Phytochrome-like protein cph2 [Planctomycetes bacterium Pla133]QDV03465.1 Phytochrome-like protein cph2 [Planctomycetes bacterium Pla86]
MSDVIVPFERPQSEELTGADRNAPLNIGVVGADGRPRPVRVLLIGGTTDEVGVITGRLEAHAQRSFRVQATDIGELDSATEEVSVDLVLLIASEVGPALASLRILRQRVGEFPVVLIGEPGDWQQRELLVREGATELIGRAELADPGVPLLERAIDWAVERHELQHELRRAREVGRHLAHHDTLTNLPNRQAFRARLRQLLAQARRNRRQLAVLFLDLDRFKHINDTLGHAVGDRLLQEVASRLKSCVRESDMAARRGGDEFNLILADIRRGQDAARVARKVQTALAKPFKLDGAEFYTSASIGISVYPADGRDVETLVKHADIAMYQAKGQGGGTHRFFLPNMNDRALERLELEQSLRLAIERQEFRLHYQPRIDLESGRITGVEALVRWQHPDLGTIHPDEFIPVAEETGLIDGLGAWVLGEACRQAVEWREQGIVLDSVAVNFSARQFRRQRPAEVVRRALEKAGLEPGRLEIEITESAVMQDAGVALESLAELRALGVQVAIDDFGTGYSSLAYLKRFPITKLKIDKTFIRTLLIDPKDAAITEAIVAMAHSLGLRACAEGVETRKQLEFLRAPGCDEVQGYVFSPPLPVEQVTPYLSGERALIPDTTGG